MAILTYHVAGGAAINASRMEALVADAPDGIRQLTTLQGEKVNVTTEPFEGAAEEEAAPAEEEAAAPAEEIEASPAPVEAEAPAAPKNGTSRRMLGLPGAFSGDVAPVAARRALLQLVDGEATGPEATLNTTIRINGAPVSRANVQAGKSQVYVIEEVLIPPTVRAELEAAQLDEIAAPTEEEVVEEAAAAKDAVAAEAAAPAKSSAAAVAVSALLAVPALFALLA